MKTKSQLLVALFVFGAVAISNLAGASDTPATEKKLALPKSPGGLKATAASFFQINLSWSDKSVNEAGFKIERSTNGKDFSQIAQVLPNTTAYRDTGLFPGSSYVYRVRAFNAAGGSKYSNERKARTLSARTLALAEWGDSHGAPPGESNWVAVAASAFHGLALKANGTVVGWGDNSYGQSTPPTNLRGVAAIAASLWHSLALKTDGTVIGWGYDGYGQATPPTNLNHIVAIAAGYSHSLALKNDGTVVEWGYTGDGVAPPPNLMGVVAIACDGTHNLALKSDGTVVGWGVNYYCDPTAPSNLTQVVAIACGVNHNLALKSDGTVVGWGCDQFGETMPPTNLTQVIAIAAGGIHSLALQNNGRVTGWGYEYGSEVTPAGLSGVLAISACGAHNLALTTAPAAPTEVSVKVISASRITVSWTDNSPDENGFKIERALDDGSLNPGEWIQIARVRAGITNVSDAGVSTNAAYWYRVRAFNTAGNSTYSQPIFVRIAPLAAPVYLTANLGTSKGVDFSWYDWLAGYDGFKVERALDAGGSPGTWNEIARVNATSTDHYDFTDTNIAINLTYWYRVRAFNVVGASPYADPVLVNIVPPNALYYLTVNSFADKASLYWYDDWRAAGYKIERAPDVGGNPGTWLEITNVGFNFNTYTDTGLSVNTTYWYRVRAYNWVGDSDYSAPASVHIVPPAAPNSVVAAIGLTNNVDVSWSENPSDEDGFQLERAPDVGGSPGVWAEIATLNFSGSYASFSDTNVAANSAYWYRVRAFNVMGFSDYSTAASVNVLPPEAPVNLNATSFADRVNLYWYDGSAGAMGFKIERAADANGAPGAWVQIATFDPAYTSYGSYTDTNRAADTTYWYRVRAFNWIGDSPYSDPAIVTIVPPATPFSLSASIGDTNQTVLSWDDYPADEDGFTVERAPDIGGGPGAWVQIAGINSGNAYNSNFTDTNATAYTTNWYRVRAFNVVGISDYSPAVSLSLVPPKAPTALSATPVVNRVYFNWNAAASGGMMGFKIERAPDTDGTPGAWAQIATLVPSSDYSTYYMDTNRAAGATYWYRVRAFNWIGDSPYSGLAVATIVPPATPSSLSARLGNTNQTVLSWDDYAADEDGFTVERAPDIGGGPGGWAQIAAINSGNIQNGNYTDTNVTAYTTNWYRVGAFNVVGASDHTDPIHVGVVPPAAPGLYASATGDRANLMWSDPDFYPAGITNFQIDRAPDAAGNPGTWSEIATVNGGGYYTYYTDPGRVTGTTNWYRVQAFNWVGGSPYSVAASVTIVPPGAPNYLSAVLGTTNHVNLSWADYSADEDGFIIERAPDAGGSPDLWAEIGTVNATNVTYTSFTDTNVTANTTNWYRVRAFSATGISPYSDSASVNVVPPPAPNLSAYPFVNRVNLSWYVYAAAISGFKIERAPDAGGYPGTWTEITDTPNTSGTDSNLTANAAYWYRARAYNWIGDSPFSDPVSVALVPPATPYYLYGTVGTTNRVNLSWYDNAQDEDGFKIERAPDVGGSPEAWTEIGSINATNFYNAYFTDTNVTANTTNWYRVRAFSIVGISDYSAPASVRVIPPDAPNNISANPLKDSINTYWNANYNGVIDGFKIERAPDAGGNPGTWTAIATNIGSVTSYIDRGLAANTQYWYRVRAFNWVGNSPYSPTASATIVPPATPYFLYGTIGTTNQVNLSWFDYAYDEDGFKIELAPNAGGAPGTWTEIGTVYATNFYYGNFPFTDTNVTANTTNWYRVRAFNIVGTSSYSPTSSVSIIPPAVPPLLAGTVASIHRIGLSWYDYDYNSVIEGYKIERALDNGGAPGTWTQIATYYAYGYSYGSYADLAVTTNKTYWYRVRAYNWVGDSAYSDAISVNDATPAPVSLTAVNDFQNQIALAWTGTSTNTSGFKIERALDLGGVPASWLQIASVSSSTTSFTDTGLLTGKTYWYRVRAYNNTGNSPYSNEATARIRVGQFIRVMQWNIEKGLGRIENNYYFQPQAIARIVNYNQPDVLLFCEVDAQNLTAAQNQAAIIDWVTNNVPYLGTQPGVTFFVAVSSKSDGFNRNAVVSRYPIAGETTFDDGLRGLHSFQVQFSDANSLQVFHTHLKCCADDCTRKQIEAQFDAGVIAAFALTNSLPYLFAGDWNEDEQNYECTPSNTYHPIQTIREGGGLVEFKPTSLNGDYRTWSSRDATPSIRFDYILAATSRLAPAGGYVFSSADWQNHGIYGNFNSYDSYYASDHYCVFANYFFRSPDLIVTPPDTLASAGFQGGPFVHSNLTYFVSNSAAGPVNWTIGKSADWLGVSASAGMLASGASTNITVFLNSNANLLATGDYSDAITFSNLTTGTSEATRAVHLTVNDPALLAVTPPSDLASLGTIGGPFIPGQQTYTLSNAGIASLTWTASRMAGWVAISATNGTLAVGTTTNVVVSISSNAVSLAAANYSDTVTFSNTASGAGNTMRTVNLTVTGFGFYDDFSTFSAGNLVGQKSWVQALAAANLPLKISGGRLVVPSPQSGDNQDAYKNFTVTSATLFYGMTLTVSNAPSAASPSYFATLYSGNSASGFANFRLTAKDNGSGTYVLGARITGQTGDPYTFGTTGIPYGTQHRVVVEAEGDGSLMKIFVDPPSPDLPDQTPYLVHYVGSGSPPAQSGSFVFSQFNSASAPIVGFTVGKIVVTDNFATAFNDLADAPSSLALFDRSLANSVIGVPPFQITSILPTNDDVLISWFTTGGTTNAVQAAPNAMGTYTDISPAILILGNGSSATSYLDSGALTNTSSRFYRIRRVP